MAIYFNKKIQRDTLTRFVSEIVILMERSDAFERGWRFGSLKPQSKPRGNGRWARTTWALGSFIGTG